MKIEVLKNNLVIKQKSQHLEICDFSEFLQFFKSVPPQKFGM